MENASKALIIAGAILLSILIIALGIYVFNMAKGASNTNALSELEVSQFNQQFTNYRGRKLGTVVIDLLDKAVANAVANKDSLERLPWVMYLDKRGNADIDQKLSSAGLVKIDNSSGIQNKRLEPEGLNASDYATKRVVKTDHSDNRDIDIPSAIGSIRSIIAEKHYYQVVFHNDDTTGLINSIIIIY